MIHIFKVFSFLICNFLVSLSEISDPISRLTVPFCQLITFPAHSLPIERGRWMSVHRNKRICPLCIGNDLGDEKHYIFHCTNINLVEIREKFLDEINKTSPDIVRKTELCFLRLTKLILSVKCEITWTTVDKFLSELLNTTEEIFRASNEVQT